MTYIDIHALQQVPPSCINRDESGTPKQAFFGGVDRHRVSSQAWKKAMRTYFKESYPGNKLSMRTQRVPELIYREILKKDPSIDSKDAIARANNIMDKLLSKKDGNKNTKKDQEKNKEETTLKTMGALLFFSSCEIDYLAQQALENPEATKDSLKKGLDSIPASVEIALFGRMLAEVPDLNRIAACQVAHAISVSGSKIEYDYFTAADDVPHKEHSGAALISSAAFTSSILYRFASINVDLLEKNLGSKNAALEAITHFIKAFAISMPTGKQNSYANNTRPDFIAVQLRDQSTSWVNAFETRTRRAEDTGEFEHTMSTSIEQLCKYAQSNDDAYGTSPIASGYLATSIKIPDQGIPTKYFGDEYNFEDLVRFPSKIIASQGDKS